jgi:hypothetical protein
MVAPNGTEVEIYNKNSPLVIPTPVASFVVTHAGATPGIGRAGMLYRDLVPDRLGFAKPS